MAGEKGEHGLEARVTTARMAVPRMDVAWLNTYWAEVHPTVWQIFGTSGKCVGHSQELCLKQQASGPPIAQKHRRHPTFWVRAPPMRRATGIKDLCIIRMNQIFCVMVGGCLVLWHSWVSRSLRLSGCWVACGQYVLEISSEGKIVFVVIWRVLFCSLYFNWTFKEGL